MTDTKNILVRYGQAEDFAPYMAVCQRAAEAAHQLDNHYKTSELFTTYHFLHEGSLTYWRSLAFNNPKVVWPNSAYLLAEEYIRL